MQEEFGIRIIDLSLSRTDRSDQIRRASRRVASRDVTSGRGDSTHDTSGWAGLGRVIAAAALRSGGLVPSPEPPSPSQPESPSESRPVYLPVAAAIHSSL